LLIYTAVIFLPPLLHGYIYPNNGDDSAYHLRYIQHIDGEAEYSPLYFGQFVMGHIIVWSSSLFGLPLNTIFLWANFLILWLVGIAVFLLVSSLYGRVAGLLGIAIVVFGTPSTLGLYDAGAIFDLMTVGIILPVLLLSVVKTIATRKWYWLSLAGSLAISFVVVHTAGLFKVGDIKAFEPHPYLLEFTRTLLGVVPAFTLIGVGIFVLLHKKFRVSRETHWLYWLFGVMLLFLLPMTFVNILGWQTRFAIDMAIVLSIMAACSLGIMLNNIQKKKVAVVALVTLIVLAGSYPSLNNYRQYQSAVRPVDEAVIDYVNGLSGKYYSCSIEVAPWIYDRYLNKVYQSGEKPYIKRSVPMTSKTTPGTRYYVERSVELPISDSNGRVVIFTDEEVTIHVYD
jgi:hypothetical protein